MNKTVFSAKTLGLFKLPDLRFWYKLLSPNTNAVAASTTEASLQKQWEKAQVQLGIEEADRGEFATEAELQAVFSKYAR